MQFILRLWKVFKLCLSSFLSQFYFQLAFPQCNVGISRQIWNHACEGGGGSSIIYFVYYCLFYFSFGSMTIKITRSHCWYFRWNKTPQSPITLSFSHYFLTGLCIFLLEQKMAKQNIAGNIWPKENEVSNKYAHFPPIKLKK